MRPSLLLLLPGVLFLIPGAALHPAAPPLSGEPAEAHRSPIDLVLLPDGRRALTANHTAGSVSLLDLADGKVLCEAAAGDRPAGVGCSPDGKRAAVSNLWDGSVTVFDLTDGTLNHRRQIAVGPLPRGLLFARDGSLFVAVSGADEVVRLDPGSGKVLSRRPAAREPHHLALSADGSLLACASSRSGEVRLWEVAKDRLCWAQKIEDGFNLRGLTFSPDGRYVVCAHAVRRDFPVSKTNIEIGWVIDNRLTRCVVRPGAGPTLEQIGLDPRGRAVGDLDGLAYSPEGETLAVSGSGTGEVHLFRTEALSWNAGDPGDLIDPDLLRGDGRFRRLPVEGRPMTVAFRPNGELVVANYLRDAVQVTDPKTGKVRCSIRLGGPDRPGLVRLGEALFHDARRSHNSWFSCHSCHPDGHTAGQNFDTLNDGSYGDAKLTPSLRGVARTAPYTWHGWQHDLGAAVRKSFVDTMSGKEPTSDEVRAVVAYLETLDHPPNPGQRNGRLTPEGIRGRLLFEGKARCWRCHEAPDYTSSRNYDVGLQADNGPYPKWNPPALRGLWDRGPFLHDGRSATLEDVLTRWHTPERIGGAKLTPAERADLIAFLGSL
jgi:cytochrome c peroxidase/DNA-binding beta-propeller fold protein YncE